MAIKKQDPKLEKDIKNRVLSYTRKGDYHRASRDLFEAVKKEQLNQAAYQRIYYECLKYWNVL